MWVVWQVIVKEFLQIRRDLRMIPVILVAPVVQITVFGFAVNTDVTKVPTVLVDEDRSAASRDFRQPVRRLGVLRGRRLGGAGRRGGAVAGGGRGPSSASCSPPASAPPSPRAAPPPSR